MLILGQMGSAMAFCVAILSGVGGDPLVN